MRSGCESVTMKSRLMANGMTTGTIGATAEKDKTRSSVLLVRIQISGNLQKKQTTTTTKQNTYALFHTTILHAEKSILYILTSITTGTGSLHDIRALTYTSRQVRRQQYIWW